MERTPDNMLLVQIPRAGQPFICFAVGWRVLDLAGNDKAPTFTWAGHHNSVQAKYAFELPSRHPVVVEYLAQLSERWTNAHIYFFIFMQEKWSNSDDVIILLHQNC